MAQRIRLLIFVGLAALALGLVSQPAAAAGKKLRFVFVSHAPNSDPWWNVVKNGIKIAAKETDVEVEYRNPPNGDIATMARLIEQAAASNPDGIISTIADYDVLGKPLKDAVRRGIP
ncbi:MAG: substrate-binding domain-containing protein, partial [Acetobacteraceae bacterium]